MSYQQKLLRYEYSNLLPYQKPPGGFSMGKTCVEQCAFNAAIIQSPVACSLACDDWKKAQKAAETAAEEAAAEATTTAAMAEAVKTKEEKAAKLIENLKKYGGISLVVIGLLGGLAIGIGQLRKTRK